MRGMCTEKTFVYLNKWQGKMYFHNFTFISYTLTRLNIFAFCSPVDGQIFINRCLYMRGMCTEINLNSFSIRGRGRFLLNLTDGLMDISNYRVASLLKKEHFS